MRIFLIPMFFSTARKQLISNVFGSGEVSPKFSRPHRLKRLMAHGAVGAALLASCLQAGSASALSFNFSFVGTGSPVSPATVTGRVDGLVDNVSGQKTGLTLTIISATNNPAGGWPTFTDADIYLGSGVTGFNVSSGQVTGVDIAYSTLAGFFALGNQGGGFFPSLTSTSFENKDSDPNSTNSLRFTPATPGPLPLFGAAAGFGWSRQLRRRIKPSV